MSGITVKMDLIKLDMVVKDIHHTWSEVPSQYTVPKAALAEARAIFRSNVKKSLSLAEKSRKMFQRESALATRYNPIAEKCTGGTDPVKRRNTEYLQHIAKGEYAKAEEDLKFLEGVSTTMGPAFESLSVRLNSVDGNGCSVTFSNSNEYQLSVTSMSMSKGSQKLKTNPRNTFTISPKSSRDVLVEAVPPIHISVRYTVRGKEESLDEELEG